MSGYVCHRVFSSSPKGCAASTSSPAAQKHLWGTLEKYGWESKRAVAPSLSFGANYDKEHMRTLLTARWETRGAARSQNGSFKLRLKRTNVGEELPYSPPDVHGVCPCERGPIWPSPRCCSSPPRLCPLELLRGLWKTGKCKNITNSFIVHYSPLTEITLALHEDNVCELDSAVSTA